LRVAELERLATALYVTFEEGMDKTVQARAKRINELKPHVNINEVLKAVEEVDSLALEAEKIFN